jgi:hypothetical protein
MAHVELSPEECAVLHEVLATRLHELRREIHHTDTRDFRTVLRLQEDVLLRLIAKLEHTRAPVVAIG